jgi:hypothetical protein
MHYHQVGPANARALCEIVKATKPPRRSTHVAAATVSDSDLLLRQAIHVVHVRRPYAAGWAGPLIWHAE